jgi:hypothetical protein
MSDPLTEIPCCSCTDYRRDKIVARLAAFYLAHEAGHQPKLTRDNLMKGCCRQPYPVMTIPGATLIGSVEVGE